MATQLKQMTGEEFVIKVLEGETSYRGVTFEPGFNLSGHEGYSGLLTYLIGHNHRIDSFDLSGARWKRVNADGLYLPFANCEGADLRESSLRGANLAGADLPRANLRGVDLRRAYLWGVDFRGAHLSGAHLSGASLPRANLRGVDLRGVDFDGVQLLEADLSGADLRGVKNLDSAVNLGYALFLETKVTQTEKAIIEGTKALKDRELFVVE